MDIFNSNHFKKNESHHYQSCHPTNSLVVIFKNKEKENNFLIK